MSDMTAFERQLSGEITGLMGPVPPVDDAAIFNSVTATQSPKLRFKPMFSATKFVVTGVIVALFGSFLLIAQPFDQQGSVPGATGDAGVFSPAGSFGTVNHTATLLSDGRVLIVGGRGDEDMSGAAQVWDPVTASFTPAGRLDPARIGPTTTLLPDGRVLVIGGWDGSAVAAAAEVWDPATASFAPAGSLDVARVDHTNTLLPDGRVLVVGGHDGHDDWYDSAEVWDPATASFGPAGSLDVARQSDAVSSLELGRGLGTATLLPDGRVLVVGGEWSDSAAAEVWDPATASFGPAGSLDVGRYDHTATLLPDGRVLVVGGEELIEGAPPRSLGANPAIPVATAIVWDPVTASFAPAGSLDVARAGHTATLLPDGRVLVVGGEDGLLGFDCRHDGLRNCPEHLVREAEVWEPSDR